MHGVCPEGKWRQKAACEAACRGNSPNPGNPLFDATYMDEILTNYPLNSEQRTRYSNLVYPHNQRRANPTDASHFIYYKHAYPLYTLSKDNTAFFGYSSGYNPNEGVPWIHTVVTKPKQGLLMMAVVILIIPLT